MDFISSLFEEEQNILSISEYNSLLNDLLSNSLLNIFGEVSELNIWQNRYIYLTLKDTNVDTVTTSLFGVSAKTPNIFNIKVGDVVQVKGYPGVHSKTGRLSLNIEEIQKLDEGTYQKKRNNLIKKLTSEGIIDESRKRKILRKFNSYALITAIPSQAFNDFVKIFNERWGFGKIDLYKAQMQGANSFKSVIKAIDKIDSSDSNYDCVIIARGGGSKEDLSSFDSEDLARRVFACKYPVISAVGHEGDVSICDLVADLRASTPSNAAEFVSTPDKLNLNQQINEIYSNIIENFENNTRLIAEQASRSYQNIVFQSKINLERLQKSFDNQVKVIQAYDFINVLNRGFSMITDDNDLPITKHDLISSSNNYNIYLKDGIKKKYKITRQ